MINVSSQYELAVQTVTGKDRFWPVLLLDGPANKQCARISERQVSSRTTKFRSILYDSFKRTADDPI